MELEDFSVFFFDVMDNALKSEINLPLERFYWLFIDFSPFTFELDLVLYKQQNGVKAFMKVCSLLNLQPVNYSFGKIIAM